LAPLKVRFYERKNKNEELYLVLT
jgi:hypothetical protein